MLNAINLPAPNWTASQRKLKKRELAAGRTLDDFKKDVKMLQRWMDKSQEAKREMVESNLRLSSLLPKNIQIAVYPS